jgi:hypothetical protein
MTSSPETEPRVVTAVCRFAGAAGQGDRAAVQWAVEMKRFGFKVGEAPAVVFTDGVYEVSGIASTVNPNHRGPTVVFDKDAPPWDLEWCARPNRVTLLEEIAALPRDSLEAMAARAVLDPSPIVRGGATEGLS